MRIDVRWLGFLAIALFVTSTARAGDDWLSVTESASCDVDATALADEIRGRMVGAVGGDVDVTVAFRDAEQGFESHMRLQQNGETLGARTLLAPTCEQSIEATAAIVALALSQHSPAEPSPNEDAVAALRDDVRVSSRPTAPRREPQGVSPRAPNESPTEENAVSPTGGSVSNLRLLASAGLDVGTLAESTAVVGGGLVFGVGRGELRGTAWYGAPSERAESSSSSFETTRHDFALAQLEYCRSPDPGRWLAVCGGVVGGFWRLSRTAASNDEAPQRQTRTGWTWGPELGAAFIYRDAPWQPQLAVHTHLPVAGKAAEASDVTIRATLGASISF